MTEELRAKLMQEANQLFNRGDFKAATDLAAEYLVRFPDWEVARYLYAVGHGDWASAFPDHDERKSRFKQIAKDELSFLIKNPSFATWPQKFQHSVRNEYYWFFELPLEQYKLGLEKIAEGLNGHYSACVGASALAIKELKNADLPSSENWALICIEHFKEFEQLAPNWSNINHFAAQALACSGKFAEAEACFADKFRKQGIPLVEDEIAKFREKLKEIELLRNA